MGDAILGALRIGQAADVAANTVGTHGPAVFGPDGAHLMWALEPAETAVMEALAPFGHGGPPLWQELMHKVKAWQEPCA
jgi:hypothetical protein